MPKQETTNHTPGRHFRLTDDTMLKLDALALHYAVDRTSMLKVLISDGFTRIVKDRANRKNPGKSRTTP